MIIILTALFALVAFNLYAGEEHAGCKAKAEKKKAQTHCPVMGGEIDKTAYADYQGQRVYFCCPGCKGTFDKEPETYMKKFEEQNILLESVQTACPISGMKIDKAAFADYKGRRVYFCCEGCKKPFMKDPATYLAKLDKEKTAEKSKGCGK